MSLKFLTSSCEMDRSISDVECPEKLVRPVLGWGISRSWPFGRQSSLGLSERWPPWEKPVSLRSLCRSSCPQMSRSTWKGRRTYQLKAFKIWHSIGSKISKIPKFCLGHQLPFNWQLDSLKWVHFLEISGSVIHLKVLRCPTDLARDDGTWLPGETGSSVGVSHTGLGGNVQGVWNSRFWRVSSTRF